MSGSGKGKRVSESDKFHPFNLVVFYEHVRRDEIFIYRIDEKY